MPMKEDTVSKTEERLWEAIKTGEVLGVIYHGGSQPGTLREISPISIKGGKVRARCFSSQTVKLFDIEKITIVDEEKQHEVSEWQSNAKPLQHYKSIADLLEKDEELLTRLGWHIESGKEFLSLHRRFKNGKPLKGSDVSLCYEEYTYDLVVDINGEEHKENWRKRVRPWTVRGKDKNTRAYGTLDVAATVFIDLAESMAPVKMQ